MEPQHTTWVYRDFYAEQYYSVVYCEGKHPTVMFDSHVQGNRGSLFRRGKTEINWHKNLLAHHSYLPYLWPTMETFDYSIGIGARMQPEIAHPIRPHLNAYYYVNHPYEQAPPTGYDATQVDTAASMGPSGSAASGTREWT